MEEYFTRANQVELDKITKLENRCNNKIVYAERMLNNLYNRRKEAKREFFCGIPIQWEEDENNTRGRRYELVVMCIDKVLIKASIHPNAHEPENSRTFIAMLEPFHHYHGSNPIYRNFKSKHQRNIKDFEDAKLIVHEFLKDFIYTL